MLREGRIRTRLAVVVVACAVCVTLGPGAALAGGPEPPDPAKGVAVGGAWKEPRPIGQPSASGTAPDSDFCQALGRINAGVDDPGDLPPYEHAAAVTAALLEVAPEELRADLTTMHETFAGVESAAAEGGSILPAFARLISPALVDAEHGLARGIATLCGLELSDPSTWPPDTASGVATGDAAVSVCPGWPRQTNAVFNNRFPYTIDTSGANYWGFNYTVEPGGWIELAGDYPEARYFSILPNDDDTNNLAQLTDVHIDPDPGSVNPWRKRVVPDDAARNYTVRLRFTEPPADPEPNTSYVAVKKDGTTPNPGGTVVYRIYGSDEGDHPNSAGVALPAVTVYAADGSVVSHHDACDPYPDGPPDVRVEDVASMPPLPLPGFHAEPTPRLDTSSNYELPVDLLANPDVQYLAYFFTQRFGDLFVVHGKALTTPDTRDGDSPVARDKDVQGWTVCNYNLLAGIANTCRLDHDVPLDDDGNYTIVVSTRGERPDNATAAEGVTWFDWGPYLDNQLTFRMFPSEDPEIRAIAGSDNGRMQSNPFVPRGVYCDRATFEKGSWDACARRAGMIP